jgi:2-methylisocitrate lyase-like PEP mutase family enzyme
MPAPTQAEKAEAFRRLHEEPGPFIIPNPWDGASAKILERLGFKALATSSGAAAGTLGKRDGQVTREESIEHCRMIAASTSLPVSGDLERCFADDPKAAAETIRLAAEAGLVGGSIEDSTGDPEKPLFDFDFAVERVAAAVEVARSLPFSFTLAARAQNFVGGTPDLDDTIKRLQAFEKAGADVLFAPGLPDIEAVRAVCQSVSKPVNFMVGVPGRSFPMADLVDAGVKRISLATSLYKAAMTGFLGAINEVVEQGTFTYVDRSVPTRELNSYLG